MCATSVIVRPSSWSGDGLLFEQNSDPTSKHRRNRIDIIYSLLRPASPQCKTALMRDSGMNSKQVRKYLDDLGSMGLMEFQPSNRKYKPTRRGNDFVRAYEQYLILKRAAGEQRSFLLRLAAE